MKAFRQLGAIAGLATAIAFAHSALAQDFPNKRMTFLIGYGAGTGVVDVPARVLAEKLEKRLGQPFILEHRPGAQSQLVFDAVNKAAPDGYTLGLGTIGLLTLPLNVKAYTLDPARDMTPVALYAASADPFVLIGSPKAPFKTLAEMIAYGKANPGKITIGAVGTSMEMEVAMLQVKAGVKAQAVPYKANTNMQSDIAGGDLSMGISSYTANKAFIDTGRLVLLGVGSKERDPKLPNAQAIGEVVPGHELTPFWFGVMAPPKTPAPIVSKLSDAVMAAMREPDVGPAFDKVGMRVDARNSADFRAYLEKEGARFREAANLIGLKPQ